MALKERLTALMMVILWCWLVSRFNQLEERINQGPNCEDNIGTQLNQLSANIKSIQSTARDSLYAINELSGKEAPPPMIINTVPDYQQPEPCPPTSYGDLNLWPDKSVFDKEDEGEVIIFGEDQ